jgi:DnaJ-class molecular chaperone
VPKKNYYQILGVNREATDPEIIAAYLQLRQKLITNHGSEEEFQEIYEAVYILTTQRLIYDSIKENRDFQPIFPHCTRDQLSNLTDTQAKTKLQIAKRRTEYHNKKKRL